MEMIGLTKTIETFAFPKQETVATDNRVTTSSSPGLNNIGGLAAKDLTAIKRPASGLVKSHVGLFSPEKRRRHCGHSPVSDESISTSCVQSLAVKPENTWVDSGQVTSSTHLVKSECPTVEGTESSIKVPCHDTAHSSTLPCHDTAHTSTGFTPFEDICLKQLLEVSRQKLFRSLEEVSGNDVRPDEQRTIRCRSLPSRMTSAKNSSEVSGLGGLRITSEPASVHSNLLSSLFGVNKDDQETSDSSHGGAANDSESYDTSEGDDSDPPTSLSGFIDIEADTPPCSPLNLTITSESVSQQFHSCDSRRHHHASPGTRAPRSLSKPEGEKPAQCRCGTSCSGGTCKERRTNFSIDAILRPDFGSGNSPNQDTHTSHTGQRDNSDLTLRTHQRFNSPHSAFKVVDLRTRSRSESLSSPTSSSSSSRSSPSPPLASPLSLPDRWARELGGVTKRSTPKGQDRFNFPHSLFPNPSKDLENFIGRHFPFIGPAQGNPLAKFPNVFPDQISHLHPGIPPDCVDPRAFYYTPENFFSKSQQPILSYDMSKIFGRSLNPFLATPPKPLPQKRPQLPPTQVEGATLKTMSTNHNSKPLTEVKTLGPPPASDQNRKPRDDPSTRVKQATDQSVHLKENSQKSDAVLKQEKANRKDSPVAASPETDKTKNPLWPAWVFCTRYSDRPSSGPRSRKPKRSKAQDEKRPRTAFTNDQLQRLKREFDECRYLTETRRKNLADELGLTESQIKIWFQNKRAKIKKSVGVRNPLALQLMEQGLYNHSTIKEMMEEGMYQHTPSQAGDDSS